jgi:protein SHQ1
MLTPVFSLDQNDEFLFIELKCPYIKATEVVIDLQDFEFQFYAKPYFLRLKLPGNCIEDGREKSSYDISSGLVKLALPKLVPGENFKDLDLLTKLMETKKPQPQKSKDLVIEVMNEGGDEIVESGQESPKDELDWQFHQQIPDELVISFLTQNIESASKYGFNNSYQAYGASITELAQDLIDVKDIDTSTIESRRNDRMLAEEMQFDSDYYMWDYCMNPEIERLLEFKPPTWKALKRIQSLEDPALKEKDSFLKFTEKEQEMMRQLPNKDYLINPEMERVIYLGLVDVLFSYCYNYRTTEGEDTVESAWNICRISGTLSALESFQTLQDTLKCSFRRSLSFPLYRSFALSVKVKDDVVVLLKLGKRAILKALLSMKQLISFHESMYLMDRIYISDYCCWIQKASMSRLVNLASELNHTSIPKSLPFDDLEFLEIDALKRQAEEGFTENEDA